MVDTQRTNSRDTLGRQIMEMIKVQGDVEDEVETAYVDFEGKKDI